MRETDGRNEVLVVTYVNGEVERFHYATVLNVHPRDGLVLVLANDQKIATLVLANARKWEWVETS